MSENETQSEQTFLVYGEGYPDEGQKLSGAALQEELSAGRLTAGDLVWCDNVWRQLSDIFELEPYSPPDFTDANEPEIALELKMLPACQVALKAKGEKASRRSLWRVLVYRSNGRLRPLPLLLLGSVVLVCAVAALLYYAVIPGFNRLYWRPSYVLVVNPYDKELSLTFLGKEYTVPASSNLTIPDIFGRKPRTETMILTEPGTIGGQKQKEGANQIQINVPLHAAEAVLVNPKGGSFFGVMNLHRNSRGVSEDECAAVVAEVSAGKAPVSAIKAAEVCRKEGSEALLACTSDIIVRSSDSIVVKDGLSLEQLGLKRSEDYIAHHADEDSSPTKKISRNLLRGVIIKNATVFYRKGKKDVCECEFKVDFKEPLIPLKKFGAKSIPEELNHFDPCKGGARCIVRFEEKQTTVIVRFDEPNSKVVRNQREMFGRWTYEAHLPKGANDWKWSWSFAGKDKINVTSLTITMTEKGEVKHKFDESGRKK